MVVSIAVNGDSQQSPLLINFDYKFFPEGGVQFLLAMFADRTANARLT